MDRTTFWKNFNMGTELDVSGAFIYNGLEKLHKMDTFYHEQDVFEVLYNISVGIERDVLPCKWTILSDSSPKFT